MKLTFPLRSTKCSHTTVLISGNKIKSRAHTPHTSTVLTLKLSLRMTDKRKLHERLSRFLGFGDRVMRKVVILHSAGCYGLLLARLFIKLY